MATGIIELTKTHRCTSCGAGPVDGHVNVPVNLFSTDCVTFCQACIQKMAEAFGLKCYDTTDWVDYSNEVFSTRPYTWEGIELSNYDIKLFPLASCNETLHIDEDQYDTTLDEDINDFYDAITDTAPSLPVCKSEPPANDGFTDEQFLKYYGFKRGTKF